MTVLTVDPRVEPPTNSLRYWVGVACRARATLTQSLPDEVLDETAPAADRPAFRLAAMLVG